MKKIISIIAAVAIAACTIPSMSVFAAERTCEIKGVTWGFRLLPGHAALQSVSGNIKNLVMPETVDVGGMPYTLSSIDIRALQNNTGIETFKFNSTCSDIGEYAFSGCKNLKKVIFSDAVSNIGMRAFENTGLESVTLPTATRNIGDYSFANCTNMTSFTAGYGLTTMGDNALYGCTSLKKVTLNRGLTKIGNRAIGYDNATTKNTSISFTVARGSAGSKYAQDNGFSYKYNISDAGIAYIRDKKYTGKAMTPAVSLTDAGYALKLGTDYTVSYSRNTNPGNALITIKGIGDYEGTASTSFYIKPIVAQVKNVKATSKKGKLTVKWKKLADASGYRIQYAKKSNFAGKKTVTAPKTASKKQIKKKLKSGKYFVRVCAYKRVGGRINYGPWSKTVKRKVK